MANGSGEFRKHLAEHAHTAMIKPIPLRSAIPDGFTVDDFTIDLDAPTATPPNGITVNISSKSRRARFTRHCQGYPLRLRCTRAANGKCCRSINTTICGTARNQLGFSHRCAAINRHRLINLGVEWDDGWQLAT